MRGWSRTTTTLAVALCTLSLAMLAGCEGSIPLVRGQSTSSTAGPDISSAHEQSIRTRVLSAVQKATDSKTTDGLDQRMSGPALAVRTSQINIGQITGTVDAHAIIPTDVSQTIIPTQSGWPRSVFTITTTTQDQQSKRLLVIKQDSARSNYKLWGLARLFPGAQLPKFAIPSIGSQMGEADDVGLKLTPKEAVAGYADVLQNGSASKYASSFADDSLRQALAELTATVQEGMARNNGTQTQTFAPVNNEIQVMRSSDGGDLVVAQINSDWVRHAGEGRESQPASEDEKALFGNTTPTDTIKVSYVNVIALYVPPANSNAQITAVGAERQPVSVVAQ